METTTKLNVANLAQLFVNVHMKSRIAALVGFVGLVVTSPAFASTKTGAFDSFLNYVGVSIIVGAVMGGLCAVFRLPKVIMLVLSIAIAVAMAVFVEVYWEQVFPRPGGIGVNSSYDHLVGAWTLALLVVPLPTFFAFSFAGQVRIGRGKDKKE